MGYYYQHEPAGKLSVAHYEAPLDVNATGATHQLLLEAVRKRDEQEQINHVRMRQLSLNISPTETNPWNVG